MTDRPIIFSSSMVRALLEGRKTMTRRLWNPQPPEGAEVWFNPIFQQWCWALDDYGHTHPYKAGDRLYVRENFALEEGTGGDPDAYCFQADNSVYGEDGAPWPEITADILMTEDKWKPCIHLPKRASRLTLTVTAVKVERLQDISDDDALAEGVAGAVPAVAGRDVDIDGDYWPGGPKRMFKDLWQSLNADRAPWESNPWVVVPTFAVHKCNIERMPG